MLNAIHRADLLNYVSGKQDMQRVSEFLRPRKAACLNELHFRILVENVTKFTKIINRKWDIAVCAV